MSNDELERVWGDTPRTPADMARRARTNGALRNAFDWLDGIVEETPATLSLTLPTLEDFIAVEEPGAGALVGTEDAALIPEDGDIMFYGDGGAGKTTLAIDLACHLAAGGPAGIAAVERPPD